MADIVKRDHTLPAKDMADIATAGDLLAQANFLGARSQGEGFLIMATCQQKGMDLISFQQKYHLRQGRFSIQAHALLAEFVSRGGTYELVERSPERAALKLTKDGNTYESVVTWEEAKEEPFVYRGNEGEQLAQLEKPMEQRQLKAKYSTPRSRMQMLWARAVSDGVVVVDPGARGGIYTPEEMDDVEEARGDGRRGGEPVEISVSQAQAQTQSVAPQQMQTQPTADDGPNPFDDQAPSSKDVMNYAVCPNMGDDCLYNGVAWCDIPLDHLRIALETDHPALKPEHYNAIRDAIAKQEGNEQ